MIVAGSPIGEVVPLSETTFVPRGGTPLLDAYVDATQTFVSDAQGVNEAFDILNGIADDAMSLAITAECVAPNYIE